MSYSKSDAAVLVSNARAENANLAGWMDDNVVQLWDQSLEFAVWVHEGQVRKYNGKPYATHPVRCSRRVFAAIGSYDMAIAMALHDGPEDQMARCPFSLVDTLYGNRVGSIVRELTNPSTGRTDLKRADKKALNREHIKQISIHAKICKTIDRIDNLCELSFKQDPKFGKLYLEESQLLVPALREGVDKASNVLRFVAEDLIEKLEQKINIELEQFDG